MFKEKIKKDLKEKVIKELKEASEELDISLKFDEDDIVIYGSIFDKENPNDIDVYVELNIDLNDSNEIYQVFDFENADDRNYIGEDDAINALKEYLHKNTMLKSQLEYEGKKVDINLDTCEFESLEMSGKSQKLKEFIYEMEIYRADNQKRRLQESELPNILNSQEAIDKFSEIANLQRKKPEKFMQNLQLYMGGGTVSSMIEHIGDLSHRINQNMYIHNGKVERSLENIEPKINNALRRFKMEKPILEEFYENIYNNFIYDKNSSNPKIEENTVEEFRERVIRDLKEYAKLHSELPVYNDVQRYARDSAVCLGNLDVEGLKYNLESLDNIIQQEIFIQEASKYDPNYEKNTIKNFLNNKIKESVNEINWSNESNAERPYNFEDDNYVVLNVKIEDVINNMAEDFKLDLNNSTGGKNAIGNRLAMAKEHLLKGEPMDYPEVGYSEYTGKIEFTNGRHRTVAAYQLGHDYIPMFIYKDTLEKFKEIVKTKNNKTGSNIMNNQFKKEMQNVIERNKEAIDNMLPETGLFSKDTYGVFEKSDRNPNEYFQSDDWKKIIRDNFFIALNSKNDTKSEFKMLMNQHLEDDLAFFGQAKLAKQIIKNEINLKREFIKFQLALDEKSPEELDPLMDIDDFQEELIGEIIDYIASKDKTKPENLYNNININLLIPFIENPNYIEDSKISYSRDHNAILLTEENIEVINQLDITQNDMDRYYMQNSLSRIEDINESLKEDGLLSYESLKKDSHKNNNMLLTKDFMKSIEKERAVFPYVLVSENIKDLLEKDSDKINLKNGVVCLHNEDQVTFLSKFEKNKEVRLQDIRDQHFKLKEVPEKVYYSVYEAYNSQKRGLKNN